MDITKKEFICNIKAIADWTIPINIQKIVLNKIVILMTRALNFGSEEQKILSQNNIFKDRHKNERCFILCAGPNVNQLDLKHLKDEYVISVSSTYHHPDFLDFAPRYHCLPQLTFNDQFTRQTALDWFREMNAKTGNAIIFFSGTELELIRSEGLFPNRNVYFLSISLPPIPMPDELDICYPLPSVQSVPIMCLYLALYMGFSRIYLLGTEHDSLITGRYDYFYTSTVLTNTDNSVNEDKTIKRCSFHTELDAYHTLWHQYEAIDAIAKTRGAKIYNATPGGILDVFPRVRYETLFNQ